MGVDFADQSARTEAAAQEGDRRREARKEQGRLT